MSKTRDARGPKDADVRLSPPGEIPQLLKPRRGLFVLLGLVLIAALGIILWLYFTTVYPHR
jgi:hypothetical protein